MSRFRFLSVRILAIAALVLGFAAPHRAGAAYESCADTFRVYNSGNHSVYSLYMRPTGGTWTKDLLGSETLAPNEYIRPLLGLSLGDSVQDMYVVYSDNQSVSATVNVCNYNEILHY